MTTVQKWENLPLDTPLAEVEGASWWQELEAAAQRITCEGCRKEAMSLISGMHDLVNSRLKKAFFDEGNFRKVAAEYQQAIQALPQCSPSQATALERCIQDIKGRSDSSVNPWATCQSSIGCALPHKQPATQEEEDQRFMDALVEALKKEGKLDA
mgnify:CR=1 FL=1